MRARQPRVRQGRDRAARQALFNDSDQRRGGCLGTPVDMGRIVVDEEDIQLTYYSCSSDSVAFKD